MIFFEATAYDREEGSGRTNITWRSSLNGLLGTGATLVRAANTLTQGVHVITATVTDSGGMTNSASVTIEIARYRPLRLQALGFDEAGVFGLRLIGDEGSPYVLQGSTNLQSWLPVRTNTMSSVFQEVRDAASSNRVGNFFYRAALAP